MEHRKVGKWGLRISEIGLGSWLTYGGMVDEQNSIDQLIHAFDLGINFFDTANVYAGGAAEIAVGKAVKQIRRDAVVVATKVFFPIGDGPNDKGLSRKHVFEQCHASLKRLNMDYIDLYQCHRYDADVPIDELVRTMDDLTRQGKILYWGVSEWTAGQIEDAVETARRINAPPPVSNQPFYNMLDRSIESEVIPMCRRLGLGQVIFSPMAQGILTGKYKPGVAPPPGTRAADDRYNIFMLNRGLMSDQVLEGVQQLGELAQEMGLTTAQLALAWCLRLNEVSCVIVGATRTSQIDENVKATGVKLSRDVLERVDRTLGSLYRLDGSGRS